MPVATEIGNALGLYDTDAPSSSSNADPLAQDLISQVRDAVDCTSVSSHAYVQPHTPKHSSSSTLSPPPRNSSALSPPPRTESRSASRKRSDRYLRTSEQWDSGSLKQLLRSTADRLEREVRRADEATSRAEYIQIQSDLTASKYSAAQLALGDAQTRAREAESECASYRRQMQLMEDRLEMMTQRYVSLEAERNDLNQAAAKVKKELRELQLSVRSQEARDQGWEEGVKLGMMKRMNEERQKVWESGYAEGNKSARSSALKEGIRIGRKEGLTEGREQGMNEERRNAVEAFQVFLSEEMEGTDEWRSEWTRRWAESVYHAADGVSTISARS